MTTAWKTNLARVADGDSFGVRHALTAMKWRLETPPLKPPKPDVYIVMRSARPANAIVPLPVGAGHDPGALAKALKTLQKRLDNAGVSGLVRSRESKLYSARTRSQDGRRSR